MAELRLVQHHPEDFSEFDQFVRSAPETVRRIACLMYSNKLLNEADPTERAQLFDGNPDCVRQAGQLCLDYLAQREQAEAAP